MKRVLFIILTIVPCLLFAEEGISYYVQFEGLDDKTTLSTMKATSQLVSLRKKRKPHSINALRYRAESDIADMLKALHASGYYEAKIHLDYASSADDVLVIVHIDPGPLYSIDAFTIDLYCKTKENPLFCAAANPRALLGQQAQARAILNAELKLLQDLSECGYPLAKIEERKITANGTTHTLQIHLSIDAGQQALFGATTIDGNRRVKPKVIENHTLWKEGEIYNNALVEDTQKALLDTGLFSSVLISHAEDVEMDSALPMRISLTETKHKSINVGATYQTFYGPGITFGWENRNVNGLGRKLSLQGDISKKAHSGVATFILPHCFRVGQDWIWQGLAMQQNIFPYTAKNYVLSSRLERKIGVHTRFSIGAKGERIFVTGSVDNGIFSLLEGLIYVRWSSADDLLNPTKGLTLDYTTLPSLNTSVPRGDFLSQTAIASMYLPMDSIAALVLAQRITVSSILSHSLHAIPVPKRLFGGTDQDLRGYRYLSVSPFNEEGKPLGGRSAIFYSVEARCRVSEPLGIVPFYDGGAVYETTFPSFKGKWYNSVGVGLRYFSFIGPIRLDIGFPLNRRHGVDSRYRVLLNIGQAF